jgi:hypothetical protein
MEKRVLSYHTNIFSKGETLMSSLNGLRLESNNKIKINFDGGDLSLGSGLLLPKEFAHKICFKKVVSDIFKTNDSVKRC